MRPKLGNIELCLNFGVVFQRSVYYRVYMVKAVLCYQGGSFVACFGVHGLNKGIFAVVLCSKCMGVHG